MMRQLLLAILLNLLVTSSDSFTPQVPVSIRRHVSHHHNKHKHTILHESSNDDKGNDEAAKYREKAEELRQQIRKMEETLGPARERQSNNNAEYIPAPDPADMEEIKGKSLKNKTVLIVGANGRLGSMVTRYLLRNHPEVKEVLAAVHYVGEASTRGYGRLSYEVGAEDGVGTIGAAWSEDRNAYFEYSDEMKDYNLNKLRVVDVELLDPVQVQTITEGVDSVIWCATDFDGNTPKAVASLDFAFLFRAVAAPTKGRCEIEGLVNVLGALKQAKQDRMRVRRLTMNQERDASGRSSSVGDVSVAPSSSLDDENDPTSFVLVSSAPGALGNYETPFGEFNGLKRQGEGIVRNDFPSLTHTILQMSCFDDNFVQESLDLQYIFDDGMEDKKDISQDETRTVERSNRRINRRDAARAAVEALLDEKLADETAEVWTDTRGK
jgi:hypothetical protein